MKGRRLIGYTTNTERFELELDRVEMNYIISCLKGSAEKNNVYEMVAKYVGIAESLVSIRDGEIIDTKD